jgi:CubicO group peptidase (beta-lactamase class C family)
MMRIAITFCLALLTIFVNGGAQEKAPVSQAMEPVIAKLDAYIEKARQDWQVPGLAVAVVKDDKVLLCRGYGKRQVGAPEEVSGDTLFAIASNSKAFTAVALAILVDEGKLSWDDHVSKHLPWFGLKDPLATADIRVRDLLCHRSGLGTFSGDLLWWGTDYSPKEVLMRARHLDSASPFRANYGYSNLMFLAAGEVVAAVSGQSWPEFVQNRILKPLEMKRTITSVRDLISTENYATPHKTLLDQSKPIPWMNWDSMAAAGGVISSAEDMSKWLRLQLRRGQLAGEDRVFSEQLAHEMWQAQTPINLPRTSSPRFSTTHFRAYGLGWVLADYHGRKTVGHGGGYDGMYSQVMMLPEENLGVVVLTNSMTSISSLIAYRAVDGVLGVEGKDYSEESRAEFKKGREEFAAKIKKVTTPVVEGTKPSHALTDYVGKFRCPMYGDATVELDGGQLVLRLHPYNQLVGDLKHLHYDTFEIIWRHEFAWFEGGSAHFVADSRGVFQQIELDVPNEDLWFHELRLRRVAD